MFIFCWKTQQENTTKSKANYVKKFFFDNLPGQTQRATFKVYE